MRRHQHTWNSTKRCSTILTIYVAISSNRCSTFSHENACLNSLLVSKFLQGIHSEVKRRKKGHIRPSEEETKTTIDSHTYRFTPRLTHFLCRKKKEGKLLFIFLLYEQKKKLSLLSGMMLTLNDEIEERKEKKRKITFWKMLMQNFFLSY